MHISDMLLTEPNFVQDGLVSVAFVDCSSKEISCDELGFTSATVFVTEGNSTLNQDMEIHSLSYQEIAKEVLEQLPDFQLLEEVEVEVESQPKFDQETF